MSNAILFSAKPTIVNINDVIEHLKNNDNVFYEVKFPIKKIQFSFPLQGFIHISGDKVKYCATIDNIVPFSKQHYEEIKFSKITKPKKWRDEWKNNDNNIRYEPWKYELVISNIESFEFDTYKIKKNNGEFIKTPPQTYTKIISPFLNE